MRNVMILVAVLFVSHAEGQFLEKLLGADCSFDVDCQAILNSECSRNTCQCKPNYIGQENNKTCIREAFLNGDCVADIQCSRTEKTSSCRLNKCTLCTDTSADQHLQCADPFGCALHPYGNKCWKNREIGNDCAASEECYLYTGSELTTHCDRVCSCRPGFVYVSNNDVGVDKCRTDSPGGASGMPVNIWSVLIASVCSALVAFTISR